MSDHLLFLRRSSTRSLSILVVSMVKKSQKISPWGHLMKALVKSISYLSSLLLYLSVLNLYSPSYHLRYL